MSDQDVPSTSRDILIEFNRKNGVYEAERKATIELFLKSAPELLGGTINRYLSAMDQDRTLAWQQQKPQSPTVMVGTLPKSPDITVKTIGIGGMFAYLNILYHAFKKNGRHCIVTHPYDIWTFSGWTLHPEEDMDERLIAMYGTRDLILNEARKLAGLRDDPGDLRFKSFRIDYASAIRMLKNSPGELAKLLKVNLDYVKYEFTDRENHWARRNLKRNAATINAFREMGRIGHDPDHDFVNLEGRVVFEVEKERQIRAKNRLRRAFGIEGRKLSTIEVAEAYGCRPKIVKDMERGEIRAVFYPGGHFLAGFKRNAMKAAKELGLSTFEHAVATVINIDPQTKKHGVTITTKNGVEKTIIADALLMALGDYAENVITVDGISTMFVIRTENKAYKIHATGMAEGGNIHIVPVWTVRIKERGKAYHYHLGKGTDGAIVGRDPKEPKSLRHDEAFFTHLEAHVRKIIPKDGRLIWIAATECGRPVTAKQGYSIGPLRAAEGTWSRFETGMPRSFVATGGCGLGGNTTIIPEVQEILDEL